MGKKMVIDHVPAIRDTRRAMADVGHLVNNKTMNIRIQELCCGPRE
jgi:hypothetical protein